MGFFDKFKKAPSTNITDFIPDATLSEYDNWLNFISLGGTPKQWEYLKTKNYWVFPEGSEEEYHRYQAAITPIADLYYPQMQDIEDDWSVLRDRKSYSGKKSEAFIHKCLENIDLYKRMIEIELRFGYRQPPNAPAFKRLAMLYEKRGDYEKSISVCVDALQCGAWGGGMRKRLKQMIAKAGREARPEESVLINPIADSEMP